MIGKIVNPSYIEEELQEDVTMTITVAQTATILRFPTDGQKQGRLQASQQKRFAVAEACMTALDPCWYHAEELSKRDPH